MNIYPSTRVFPYVYKLTHKVTGIRKNLSDEAKLKLSTAQKARYARAKALDAT